MKWIKWIDEFPPYDKKIVIAMRIDNMGCNDWIYEVCYWWGGDPDNIENWNGKQHTETPIYWCPIVEPND